MIEIKNVEKYFGKQKVLNKVSFEINKGEIIGIVGHSGAGKSTILRCINGLEKYQKGSVKVFDKEVKNLNDEEIRNLRKKLGMIFQSFNLMESRNVIENVILPMEIWNEEKSLREKKAKELIKLVGLESKLEEKISNLSGGQRQRVAIARALSLNPEVLLCDEATSALDPKTTKEILELLYKINKQMNLTVVIVTHQMEVIKEVCEKVVVMEDGEVKAFGRVKEVFLNPSGELKKLLGEEEILPKEGINLKLIFPPEISKDSIITKMARHTNTDFSIAWGKLEKFRDEVLGSLIINISKCDEKKICSYLNKNNIGWEEI